MWSKRLVLLTMGGLTALPAVTAGWTGAVAGAEVVVVHRGDSLTSLASRHHTTVAALAALNGIRDRDHIEIGQRLQLPGDASSSADSDSVGSRAAAAAASVVVRAGDNLTSLASRYGTTVATLAALNGIGNRDHIEIGQRLELPGVGPSPGSVGSRAAAAAASVVVRAGDNLTSLASRYGTTVATLAALNGIGNSDHIEIGQRLDLPGTAAASSSLGTRTAVGWLPNRAVDSPSLQRAVPMLRHWAAHYGVPASLLEAVTWWESGWDNSVVSSTGAVGIGQLEPSTVRDMRVFIGIPALSASRPDDNIRMSAAFLAHLLAQTGGQPGQAVAAYYQGLASVQQQGLLAETSHYVQGVLAYERLFRT